jgi:hypothetical protein
MSTNSRSSDVHTCSPYWKGFSEQILHLVVRFCEWHGLEHGAFHGEPGADADQQTELLAFAGGGQVSLRRRCSVVVQDDKQTNKHRSLIP